MGILIGDIKYRGKGVAKEVIDVTVSWLNKNFGIKNFLLGVDFLHIEKIIVIIMIFLSYKFFKIVERLDSKYK